MAQGNLLFTKEHEWVRIEGKKARMGISDHAQHELGDVVFVELPNLDDEYEKGDGFAVVESVKAVSDVYAPISGKVVAINEKLDESPELINEDPYGEGWIAELEMTDDEQVKGLMSEEEYKRFADEA